MMVFLTILRVFLIVICLWSVMVMARDFYTYRDEWNEKTRDYWYGRVMWVISGISAGIEGILRHVPFRYSLVFIIAAALATLKGNLQRGGWGNGSNDKDL